MATMHDLAAKLKANAAVRLIAASHNQAQIETFLAKYAQNPGMQLGCIMAMQDLAEREPSGLAHEIVMRQSDRISQYASNAFPLSTAQVGVCVKDLARY